MDRKLADKTGPIVKYSSGSCGKRIRLPDDIIIDELRENEQSSRGQTNVEDGHAKTCLQAEHC